MFIMFVRFGTTLSPQEKSRLTMHFQETFNGYGLISSKDGKWSVDKDDLAIRKEAKERAHRKY